MKPKFKRHFRVYLVNNHPAYIVDEEGNKYIFHRVTHSKTSGGKKNWEKKNPLLIGGEKKTYIVKKEEIDNKNRFSPFELETKPGININYPEIKRAGRSQNEQDGSNVNNNCTSTHIKTNHKKKRKKRK